MFPGWKGRRGDQERCSMLPMMARGKTFLSNIAVTSLFKSNPKFAPNITYSEKGFVLN